MAAMTAAGLAVRRDAAGNVIGRLGPAEGPAVLAGSPPDTVPRGGAYDGALGVLAALECARVLGAADQPLAQAFEVVAFADEEGAYGNLYGSRAMLGDVGRAELEAALGLDGEPLAAALARIGRSLDGVPDAARRPGGDRRLSGTPHRAGPGAGTRGPGHRHRRGHRRDLRPTLPSPARPTTPAPPRCRCAATPSALPPTS